MDSEEYKEWYDGHKEECECNYKGSSNGMEIAGVKLFGYALLGI